MDSKLIFIKTDKGREEVEKRTHRLSFRLRTTLIMMDGSKTAGELIENLPTALGSDPTPFMQQLWEEGFITTSNGAAALPIAAAVSAPARAGAAAGGPASAESSFDLKIAQRKAARFLEDSLGPSAEALCMAIEKTKTRTEFNTQAERCHAMLTRTINKAKADAFWVAIGL
jgi:hypothetical protein